MEHIHDEHNHVHPHSHSDDHVHEHSHSHGDGHVHTHPHTHDEAHTHSEGTTDLKETKALLYLFVSYYLLRTQHSNKHSPRSPQKMPCSSWGTVSVWKFHPPA